MPRYRIVITTQDTRRLHFHTDNEVFIMFLHDCANKPINVQVAQQLSLEELIITDYYLDDPISCEIIDNHTKTSHLFPF